MFTTYRKTRNKWRSHAPYITLQGIAGPQCAARHTQPKPNGVAMTLNVTSQGTARLQHKWHSHAPHIVLYGNARRWKCKTTNPALFAQT